MGPKVKKGIHHFKVLSLYYKWTIRRFQGQKKIFFFVKKKDYFLLTVLAIVVDIMEDIENCD